METKKRICFVVAAPTSADGFLTEQIAILSKEFDVFLAANGSYGNEWRNLNLTDFFDFPIRRNISIANDIKALWRLTGYFWRMKFDAVHSITPKAGLLCSLASFFAKIKHRSHTFTGQVWATRTGLMRFLLKTMDWVTAHLDNHLFADGEGQRKFLVSEGVVREKRCSVMANGSICGVRVDLFSPSETIRIEKRKELGLSKDKVVYVFLGRINEDKGCYELLEAFNELVLTCPNAYLLMYGRVEEDILQHVSDYKNLVEKVNFCFAGFTNEPQNILKACDVFVLPTHREGFGVSVIEASSVGIPVVTSDVYGVVDAALDGKTGICVPVGDSQLLKQAMERLYNDADLRNLLGHNGRERILKEFRSDIVVGAWVDFYHQILS